MSKCPFWSTGKERVSCYSECPMSSANNKEETCPFAEHLVPNKINFKEIVQDEYEFSEEDNFDSILSSYAKIK